MCLDNESITCFVVVVEVVEVAEVAEVVEEEEAPRVVDKQARRSEVRNANRGSISSKLVASPSSVDIVVDIVVDNVVDNNGPASFRHTSNMWVNPPLSSSSSSSLLLLLLLVVLVVVVLPWRWWCSRRMVCVTRFKSHPKRRRWMVAMPSFFLFVCTKSFKMQFRSRLLRATTMASSSNTRLRKYWQNKS